ncbi:sulfur carrier protein ThiS [Megasphaera hexanoica]|uniref:Sulfur carrier protein ThiS n=1 Tax=Megasphaera hexanoica TaxID=1675036 RepID=A0A848BR74_9FIRM|nr:MULTISPECIES: sulfur carrier protein ThiS [Megasphaera]AXB81472.1 hypothetical protein ACT01_04030 [Megasphaera hexanoica]KUH56789.1 hypothetical protein AT798_11065 [Megasphaera sp. DJF_B143]MDY2903808.1 sulfur carrier protein ThiS [Caecibacter massiliensis]NME27620.1 sulfur carrier protein ThiS [Megasphaera hexanoica]
MTIQVNGEPFQTEIPISVTTLLKEARVEAPEYVTVQLNQQFIRRDDFDTTVLSDGDVVDFLYYMGGGSR